MGSAQVRTAVNQTKLSIFSPFSLSRIITKMQPIKVHYFNGRGRAEVIRLALVQAGQEFEDIRYERADWPKHKETAPQGTVPYIEVDDQQLSQSMACARYIASKYGLMGKDGWAEALVNQVLETHAELWDHLVKIFLAKTEEDKVVPTEKAHGVLVKMEKLLLMNGDGDGFYVGESVTLADLASFTVLEFVPNLITDAKDKVPKLSAHFERVANLPKIADWLETRP